MNPLETIRNAILSFFELVEAEGRTLKQKTLLILEGFMLMFFGASLLFFGVIAAGAAFYLWLSSFISSWAAALVVAVILAVLGVLLLYRGRKCSRDGGGSSEQQ